MSKSIIIDMRGTDKSGNGIDNEYDSNWADNPGRVALESMILDCSGKKVKITLLIPHIKKLSKES